jgi:thiol-disulfide isomerase/thioredoxin
VSFFGARRHPGVTPLPVEGRLGSFDRATGWLNSPPLNEVDLRGKVVLVDFWTYTCINWLRTLAYVRAWHEKYRDRGLVVVGVHTPEFWFEQDPDNVRRAAQEMHVEYPVALDPDYGVWNEFANRYWPAVYLSDAEGRIRYHHFGEGDYDDCERAIQMLLREAGADGVDDESVAVSPTGFEAQADWENLGSPETYLGSGQGRGRAASADSLPLNQWALTGEWTVEPGAAVATSAGSTVAYRFHARDANLVLRARQDGAAVPFRVLVDGEPPGDAAGLDVDGTGSGTLVEPRLYQLIRQPGSIADRTFEIRLDAPGVEAYVFTFG